MHGTNSICSTGHLYDRKTAAGAFFASKMRQEVTTLQEDIENRTVNLAISTTKLTARTILKGAAAFIRDCKQSKGWTGQEAEEVPHGQQSIQELIAQNQGVSSVPIEQTQLRGMEKILGKYGVDFAIVKDRNESPPRYTIFFKARDADALTEAFTEYSNQLMKRKDRPSVLEELRGGKEAEKAKTKTRPEKNLQREKIPERER